MTLKDFIENALNNSDTNTIFELDISKETCKKIKDSIGLNVYKYKFTIKENYIRHVKNRHPNDIDLLEKIPDILNTFFQVEKSITRNPQTGGTEISLVFRKKIDSNIIQMVSLRVIRDKELSFKTVFRKDTADQKLP